MSGKPVVGPGFGPGAVNATPGASAACPPNHQQTVSAVLSAAGLHDGSKRRCHLISSFGSRASDASCSRGALDALHSMVPFILTCSVTHFVSLCGQCARQWPRLSHHRHSTNT